MDQGWMERKKTFLELREFSQGRWYILHKWHTSYVCLYRDSHFLFHSWDMPRPRALSLRETSVNYSCFFILMMCLNRQWSSVFPNYRYSISRRDFCISLAWKIIIALQISYYEELLPSFEKFHQTLYLQFIGSNDLNTTFSKNKIIFFFIKWAGSIVQDLVNLTSPSPHFPVLRNGMGHYSYWVTVWWAVGLVGSSPLG